MAISKSFSIIFSYVIWALVCTTYSLNSHSKILRGYTQNVTNEKLKYAYSAVQDKRGYLWFATRSGLQRFDGNQLHAYTAQINGGLSSSHVRFLYIDHKQTLWVGTIKGLNRYDLSTQTLSHIRDPNHPQLDNINISGMFMDQQGLLWISTRGHELVRYNPNDNTFSTVAFTTEADRPKSAEIQDFTDIKQDINGNIWLASRNGLYQLKFDTNTNELINSHKYTTANSDISGNFVVRLGFDKHNNIWIGTNKGISYFHLPSQKLTAIKQVTEPSEQLITDLAMVNIGTFSLDKQNRLWIGTWGKGVHLISPKQQDIIHNNQGFKNTSELNYNSFVYQDSASDDILANEIFYLYADNNGRMWIIAAGNIKTLKTSTLAVNHIKYIPNFNRQATKNPTKLIQNEFSSPNLFIRDIFEDSHGYLWLSSYRGLSRYHKEKQSIQYFYHQQDNSKSLPSNHAIAIFEDKQQQVWVGTQLGLTRFNPQTLDFTRIPLQAFATQNTDSTSTRAYIDNIFNFGIQAIVQDSQNNIWVSNDNQLLKLNDKGEQLGSFELTAANQRPNPLQKITAVQFDGQHTFWIATNQIGLSKFSLIDNSYSLLTDIDNAPNTVINDIHIDNPNKIWLATDVGLSLFDGNQKFEHFNDPSSPIMSFQAIEQDNHNNLWIGTDKGIKSFNTNDQTFAHWGKNHGIQNTQEIIRQASFRSSDGNLYFGGAQGIDHFHPNNLDRQKEELSVILTDFLLANQSVAIATENRQQNQPFTLEKAIDYLNQITLEHHYNVFSFKFGTLNFINPEQTQYRYRLKGFDDNWLTTDNTTPLATFTNIPAGQYHFEVKAASKNTSWSNIKQITINILPPWWQTKLAYALYILVIFTVIWGSYRWRTARIIARSEALEKQVVERTETISQLMAQKDHMFANISHEFRTPLTLISTPAQRLLAKVEQNLTPPDDQEISQSATTIIRNSERLLRMVEQLIEYAKSESNSDAIGKQYYSLKQTINYLITCFDSTFAAKNLNVTVKPFEDVVLLLKPDALEIILTNLLSNAVKYTPNNGTITIDVSQQQQQIAINIKDTGIGIADADKKRIFERFGRAQTKTDNPAGTGIGLALVKQIVESNQGQISLTSELNQGSCFAITLPIANKTEQLVTPSQPSSTSKQITALEISNLANNETLKADPLAVNPDLDTKPEPTAQHNNQQILVIDDNQELLNLIHDILSPHFQCQLALDGEQGLEIAKQQLPDLVISDLMMPGISGLDVLSQLKSDSLTSHIPVVLLTAKGDTQSRIEGWKNRADEYISKPFNDQELIVRINNILTIRKMLSSRYQQQFTQHSTAPQNLTQHQAAVENESELDIVATNFSLQLETILEQYYQDENLSVTTIAKQMALSSRQLARKTKTLLDLAPNECLRAYRLKKAAELLEERHTPSTIAFEVGFNSHSYFSACFKAKFGCTPSNYRKNTL